MRGEERKVDGGETEGSGREVERRGKSRGGVAPQLSHVSLSATEETFPQDNLLRRRSSLRTICYAMRMRELGLSP